MISFFRQSTAQKLLIFSILACVLEGTLRKWIFRESAAPVRYGCYFAKDVIFAGIIFCRPIVPASALASFKKVLMIGLPIILIGAALSATQGLNVVGAILSFRALIVVPL